jgi:hypothetical protein
VKFSLRDPAAWAGVVEAALLLLLSFDLFGLTSDSVALIMAAVTSGLGLLTAVLTKRAGLSMAIGFLKAVIALAAGYGWVLTEQQTMSVIGLATVILSAFNWANNAPAARPGLHEEYDLAA